MKHFLSFAALATALTSGLLARPADACGGYTRDEPTVFRVATHGGRSFVLTHVDNREGAKFSVILPHSYDSTAVAVLPAQKDATKLTLVGVGGTAEVTSNRPVLVANDYMHTHGKQMAGLELSGAKRDFQIALVGEHYAVNWDPIDKSSEPSAAEKKWLIEANNLPANTKVSWTRFELPDAQLVAFSSYDAQTGEYTTTLRSTQEGNWFAGRRQGVPFGVLTADGSNYLVMDNNGVERAWEI